jgi:3',5'-nucleoside bisphosphate phosphatase
MPIDLQLHTTYSDGHDTPEELAKLAHEGGLKVISATEHDRVDSYEDVKKACEPYGIKVISGVEISTVLGKVALHVLGYNIDTKNEELLAFLRGINEYRQKRFIELFPLLNETLREAGKREADVEKFKNRDAKYYSHPGVVKFLREEKIIEHTQEGFKYLSKLRGTVPHISVKEAVEMIHKAGGKAVLSHPFAPKISLTAITPDRAEQEEMLKKFKEEGLDGLECYQAGHSILDVEFCLKMAEKYNFIITAGSDWHGYHSPDDKGIREYLPYYINKPGDLVVPEEKIEEILKGLGVEI